MPLDVSKIVMLVIFITGFVIAMYYLKDSLNKQCSGDEHYDNGLKRCIKTCKGNTKYQSSSNSCVSICNSTEQLCGDQCIPNTQLCCDKNTCLPGQNACCGDQCMDDKHVCIGNNIYPKSKQCGDSACGDNEQCGTDKKCYPCPDNQAFCPNSNKCCLPNQRCNKDGLTCESSGCDETEMICGNNCCKKGSQQCSGQGKCVDCANPLCDDVCCPSDTTCIGNVCCSNDKIYNKGKSCCANQVVGDKCCASDEKPMNGKCYAHCPVNNKDEWYDPDTHQCITRPDGTSYIGSLHCLWTDLVYDPQDMKGADGQSHRVCKLEAGKNGYSDKYYIATPSQPYDLYRSVSDHFDQKFKSDNQCTIEDCQGRLAEENIKNITFTSDGYCSAKFSCNNTNLLPSSLLTCPFSDNKRCCTDSDRYTGQVCKENEICDNGFCTSCKGCNGHGTCSKTVSGLCICDPGFDFQSECQDCLKPKIKKTARGVDYCVQNIVQYMNYFYSKSDHHTDGVLTSDNRRYLDSNDPDNRVFTLNMQNLSTDKISKIIFEPTLFEGTPEGNTKTVKAYLINYTIKPAAGNPPPIDLSNDTVAVDVSRLAGFPWYIDFNTRYDFDGAGDPINDKIKVNIYFA